LTIPAKTARLQSADSLRIAILVAAGALGTLAVISFSGFVVVMRHGISVAAVLAAAVGLGSILSSGLRLGTLPRRWRVLLSAGLGLGALSLLVLALGGLGLLQRGLWFGILAAAIVVGLLLRPRSADAQAASTPIEADPGPMVWLWLATIAFLGLSLVAATMPPGVLWPAEGNGYDELEYHLGGPREYLEAGRIAYLPHNLYTNFPFNVEMLYLLTMVLRGDPVAAAFDSRLINLVFGMLAVGAVWLAGREFGRPAGHVAGLLAASCPFVTYLCGVAYVENALLFFAALSLAAAMRAHHAANAGSTRWSFVAGLCSGLACGCKYTAAPAVVLPLGLWMFIRGIRKGIAAPATFLLGAVLAFAPWLVKNLAATGSPVFPLARAVFPERPGVWSDEAAARWQEGHLPSPDDRPIIARAARLWREVAGSALFGPLIVLGVIAGIAGRPWSAKSREGRAPPVGGCWMMLLVGAGMWLGFTHLVGRFAIVLIVPAAVLCAAAWAGIRSGTIRRAATALLVLLMAFNLRTTLGLFTDAGVFQIESLRQTEGLDWFTTGQWPTHAHVPVLNELAGGGGRVLMIGDARRFYLDAGVDYCVVFGLNPFAEAAQTLAPTELLRWLRDRGYDYVYVDWSEMARLRGSRYGFWPSIDATLIQRLVTSGLKTLRAFTFGDEERLYATLYEVPASND